MIGRNILEEQGCVLLKQVLAQDEIKQARDSFQNDGKRKMVNYPMMSKFIDEIMMKRVDKELGWNSTYVKFRGSDNNNSSDASTFHRDLISHTESNISPCFTCLAYLDKTTMEIIPSSHQIVTIALPDSKELYQKKVPLKMEPGDLLVFYSTLLHRGIFTEQLANRRLIQVFEVFPNKELYDRYANQILHIPTDNTERAKDLSKMMIAISKSKVLVSMANALGYMNASTGYGRHIEPMKKLGLTEFKWVSSEAKQPRIQDWNDPEDYSDFGGGRRPSGLPVAGWQEGNQYAVVQPTYTLQDQQMKDMLYEMQYTRTMLGYVIVFILLLIILYFLYKFLKRQQYTLININNMVPF
jgi:hypothetical protein